MACLQSSDGTAWMCQSQDSVKKLWNHSLYDDTLLTVHNTVELLT